MLEIKMTIQDRLKTYNQLTRYIIYGQISFLTAVLICVLLLPQSLSINDGFSYFGGHTKTVVFFTLGLALLGLFYFKVFWELPSKPYLALKVLGYFTCLALAVNIVTPFNHGPKFHWVHVAASIVVYASQSLMAVWLLVSVRWDLANVLLCGLLLLEVLFAFLYLHPEEGFLLHMEVAYQITFAVIFARSLSRPVATPQLISSNA